MRNFQVTEVNDLISHVIHATDISHNTFIWSYLHICCRTCKRLILRHISLILLAKTQFNYLFFFIKPTPNAPPIIHEVIPFDQHSDAFRRSPASSSGSFQLTVHFCQHVKCLQTTVRLVLWKCSLHSGTQFIKLHGDRFEG